MSFPAGLLTVPLSGFLALSKRLADDPPTWSKQHVETTSNDIWISGIYCQTHSRTWPVFAGGSTGLELVLGETEGLIAEHVGN